MTSPLSPASLQRLEPICCWCDVDGVGLVARACKSLRPINPRRRGHRICQTASGAGPRMLNPPAVQVHAQRCTPVVRADRYSGNCRNREEEDRIGRCQAWSSRSLPCAKESMAHNGGTRLGSIPLQHPAPVHSHRERETTKQVSRVSKQRGSRSRPHTDP